MEAGLAPSSLVQRFGTRRGLLLAFAARAAEGVAAVFAAAEERAASPLDALEAALVAMVARVRGAAEMAHHVAFLHLDLSDPEFRRHAVAHGLALRAAAARLIAAAAARGELPPDVDAESRARALHVAYNGALVTWAMHEEGTLVAAVRTILPLVFPDRRGAPTATAAVAKAARRPRRR